MTCSRLLAVAAALILGGLFGTQSTPDNVTVTALGGASAGRRFFANRFWLVSSASFTCAGSSGL